MSTRSRIGMIRKDGTIISIYCHFDGYPEGVGETLKTHWTETAKIRKLMALGDISVLGPDIGVKQNFDKPTPGTTLAYGRDRNEKGVKAVISKDKSDFMSVASNSGAEWAYLWDGKKWITTKVPW